MLCPKCKKDRAHRSHRTGLTEHLASLAGFYPYACRACNHRFLQFVTSWEQRPASANPGVEREIAASRSAFAWKRKQREILLYGLALLLFVAILYFLTRDSNVGGA